MRARKISPNIIRRIIAEERALLAEYSRYNTMLVREASRMRSEGFDRHEINEGLMDIIKSLGGGFIETFKYQIAMKIIQVIGLKANGLLARLIANIIENADIMEFKKYFGADACQYLPGLIVDALAETSVEPYLDGFIDTVLGIQNNRLADSAREALTNSIMSTEFLMGLKEQLTDYICEIDISDIVDEFKNVVSGAGDDVADVVRDATAVAGDVVGAVDAATS